MGDSLFYGGTGNIIKGFEKLMYEEGIKIIKDREVTKIISNKKVTGIQLNDQTIIESENVICNADPPAVYEKMLKDNTNNSFLFKWKTEWNIQWDYLFIILVLKKI